VFDGERARAEIDRVKSDKHLAALQADLAENGQQDGQIQRHAESILGRKNR